VRAGRARKSDLPRSKYIGPPRPEEKTATSGIASCARPAQEGSSEECHGAVLQWDSKPLPRFHETENVSRPHLPKLLSFR
jgi:hypothetical protein